MAGDGPEAVWRATEFGYDAIVLDAMIPAGRVRGVPQDPREGRWAPVLMLTARDDVADRIRGLDAGADDYLTKPFAFGRAVARLRAVTRRGPAERPVVLRVNDLTAGPGTRLVWPGRAEIALSPKEFALLASHAPARARC